MLSQKILLAALSIAAITMGTQPAQANIHNPYVKQMSRTYQRLTQTFSTHAALRMSAANQSDGQTEEDSESLSTGSGHFWESSPTLTKPVELDNSLAQHFAPELDEVRSGGLIIPGLKGPSVQKISGMLQELGYPVEPSDYYDREMAWQVSRFQQEHHLADSNSSHLGKIGRTTLDALESQASQGLYNAELGQKLVAYARSHVSGTKWNCYRYVAYAIHAHLDDFLQGMHAYMAADHLAQNEHFKEIDVSVADLPELPAGAIVVWGKGSSRSGHISIADGQGKEISDHVSVQMLAHYGGASHRVFLPVRQKS